MSQDVVSDALNMLKNAKKVGKTEIKVKIISNLLIEILKIMKQKEAIKKYKINAQKKSVEITLGEFSECGAIKPRFTVDMPQIDKYRKRFLPARNIGTIIISTNKGLLTHEEASEEGIGGCLIAYFY
ncbi:MAG: 30S ribosomal protein S8 [Nanoarchaeota archaeon]